MMSRGYQIGGVGSIYLSCQSLEAIEFACINYLGHASKKYLNFKRIKFRERETKI